MAELFCGSLNIGSDDTIEYLPSGDKLDLQFPNAYQAPIMCQALFPEL